MVFKFSSSYIEDIFDTRSGSPPLCGTPPSSPSSPKASCSFLSATATADAQAAPSAPSRLKALNKPPWWQRILRKYRNDNPSNCILYEEGLQNHLGQIKRFSIGEILRMSDNFTHFLGKGGFAMVYKGHMMDGSTVAIKRTLGSNLREFLNELKVNSVAKHRNLIPVLGFCITPTELFVVFPYMIYGSLANLLRSSQSLLSDRETTLEWSIRMKFAIGIAKALSYLHEDCNPRIIHRDVKSANVLMHENQVALADFGLCVFMDYEETCVESHVVGTHGQIDPEFFKTGRCTVKTDVYAYGIMLLELISGKGVSDLAQASDKSNLFEWVKSLAADGNLHALIDCSLKGKYVEEEMMKLMRLATACTERSPWRRPEMPQVVRILEGNAHDYVVGWSN